ncbi:hypothetical protein LX36DRAFT_143107 [Colletotrichum falcatum]|nr:hypothetical protein LX36DRAFT_143107 [Colletotrichum falcatum]
MRMLQLSTAMLLDASTFSQSSYVSVTGGDSPPPPWPNLPHHLFDGGWLLPPVLVQAHVDHVRVLCYLTAWMAAWNHHRVNDRPCMVRKHASKQSRGLPKHRRFLRSTSTKLAVLTGGGFWIPRDSTTGSPWVCMYAQSGSRRVGSGRDMGTGRLITATGDQQTALLRPNPTPRQGGISMLHWAREGLLQFIWRPHHEGASP